MPPAVFSAIERDYREIPLTNIFSCWIFWATGAEIYIYNVSKAIYGHYLKSLRSVTIGSKIIREAFFFYRYPRNMSIARIFHFALIVVTVRGKYQNILLLLRVYNLDVCFCSTNKIQLVLFQNIDHFKKSVWEVIKSIRTGIPGNRASKRA